MRKIEVHVDVQTALSSILYTLCKVRGAKIIVGFLNNEPRYLEPVLAALEAVTTHDDAAKTSWKVPYVLLLWLSHLLLTPFDLASISARPAQDTSLIVRMQLHPELPAVAQRIIQLGIGYLSASTKAQDAAAAMLVRLTTRPDMQRLQVGDAIVDYAINELSSSAETPTTIYQQLGPLRLLAGTATSADLSHLIPRIYRTCEGLSNDASTSTTIENAVGKKLIVKIFRNIAILMLRSSAASGPLLSFLETTSVLEDVIDHLLQSLGDRDTPVRYAAAKAISLIILELEPEMGHEVIQAVLDTFKEDIPRNASSIDYQTVNALKWHGLSLTLSHALFKRSASPAQLPDILNALVSALNFEQRTATGSSIGTNVRDAANFGIWSLSRRYTSDELLSVDTNVLRFTSATSKQTTAIQAMAVQLLLSACLDPAGNIRRGSSAALQELIGRHPNRVIEGISVVQIVDYQAVGLRKRGLIDVAGKAASLDVQYWEALVDGLIAWRGLQSVDVISREAAASSLAHLVSLDERSDSLSFIADRLLAGVDATDIESAHGFVCSLSNLLGLPDEVFAKTEHTAIHRRFWHTVHSCGVLQTDFNSRTLKSELPVAVARLIATVCSRECAHVIHARSGRSTVFADMNSAVERLLARSEDPILQVIPDMVQQFERNQRSANKAPGSIGLVTLSQAVASDGTKAVLTGAGRAIALGAIVVQIDGEIDDDEAVLAIKTLATLVRATNVDWRIIGLRALHLALQDLILSAYCNLQTLAIIMEAVHAGLTDYTIDERGDIGSLVRLQGLTCVQILLSFGMLRRSSEIVQPLQSDVLRLSLEKLDRVRSRAATCRQKCLPYDFNIHNAEDANSEPYLRSALQPIFDPTCPAWAHRALVEGAISCAGISGESLLQTTRALITDSLRAADTHHLHTLLTTYSSILRDILSSSTPNSTNLLLPTLDVLAFLLDMNIPQRLATTQGSKADQLQPAFKWLTLLSLVQKSHHKSADVPRLLAAVHVYRGLAEVAAIRAEVVKKLLSMLATNPYPRVKVAVAEVVFEVLEAEEMKGVNWAEKGAQQSKLVGEMRARYVERV